MKKKERDYTLLQILFAILILLACCAMSSCKTKYVVESVKTDSVYITKTQYDSIWQHDSIYLHEYAKGETIFVEKEKWKTFYKERVRIDTLIENHVDSVAVPYPMEKELRWGQKTAIKFFPWLLVACAGLAGWTFRKPLKKLIAMLI
ncbi:MAG: hypothetical protein IJ197_08760 [Bacteroidaceae bacterium]|nr:hypothetical protein [Bacteroidaceae bacterium]